MEQEENLKNGYIGEFGGYRINGKSYDADGKEIDEVHKEDCFCCRNTLLTSSQSN